jgi:hypothetical protein
MRTRARPERYLCKSVVADFCADKFYDGFRLRAAAEIDMRELAIALRPPTHDGRASGVN